MRLIKVLSGLLFALSAACLAAAAQLSPTPPDPLARIRDAAKTNVQACSATGETLCEQVAPKIVENAMGESPLAENLRHLTEVIGAPAGRTSAPGRAIAWAVAAFRDAGVDVRTEKYASRAGGPADRENVVAEIRGREKPDEWVLLGARLESRTPGAGASDNACDAAMVIEAARDIQKIRVRPRRSIRFVLFTGDGLDMPGSWAYIRAHRADLDRARAAIIFGAGCGRMTGYSLNGRHDIEPGVREAMKPIESLGAGHYDFDAPLGSDNFDFLVEGVPTLVADREGTSNMDIKELKRDTAIVAVTAFGIAERAESIGPRQSRVEIESLLGTSGLDQQMKRSGLWPLWESGERGRLP